MFIDAFVLAEMICEIVNVFQYGDWAILEWQEPISLRGGSFLEIRDGRIRPQRG